MQLWAQYLQWSQLWIRINNNLLSWSKQQVRHKKTAFCHVYVTTVFHESQQSSLLHAPIIITFQFGLPVVPFGCAVLNNATRVMPITSLTVPSKAESHPRRTISGVAPMHSCPTSKRAAVLYRDWPVMTPNLCLEQTCFNCETYWKETREKDIFKVYVFSSLYCSF